MDEVYRCAPETSEKSKNLWPIGGVAGEGGNTHNLEIKGVGQNRCHPVHTEPVYHQSVQYMCTYAWGCIGACTCTRRHAIRGFLLRFKSIPLQCVHLHTIYYHIPLIRTAAAVARFVMCKLPISMYAGCLHRPRSLFAYPFPSLYPAPDFTVQLLFFFSFYCSNKRQLFEIYFSA